MTNSDARLAMAHADVRPSQIEAINAWGPGHKLIDQAEQNAREAFAAIDPWASYPYPASALAAYFSQGDNSAPLLAVRIDDHTVGVIGLRLNWLRGPYLQFLGFLPPYQSLGLGALVMGWLDAEMRRSGQHNLFVCTSDFNAAALRFYERHGFARVGTLKGLVREDRDEVLLHKKL